MAKRKSMNRRSSRYSRSSFGSGCLDPETNIFDDDQPLWWKNLENNTVVRSSTELSHLVNYTNSMLDSNSNARSTGGSTEWWKELDASDPKCPVPSRHTPDTAEEDNNNLTESMSSDSEKDARILKKKKSLRAVPRRSQGNSAFLLAMQNSKNLGMSNDEQKNGERDLRNELSNELSNEIHDDSTSLILKSKRRILRKSARNRSDNVFQDLLANEEVPLNRVSKTVESRRSMTGDRVNGTSTGTGEDSIVHASNNVLLHSLTEQDDGSIDLFAPNAQSSALKSARPSLAQSDDSDVRTNLLQPKSRLFRRMRKSSLGNVFEDILGNLPSDDDGKDIAENEEVISAVKAARKESVLQALNSLRKSGGRRTESRSLLQLNSYGPPAEHENVSTSIDDNSRFDPSLSKSFFKNMKVPVRKNRSLLETAGTSGVGRAKWSDVSTASMPVTKKSLDKIKSRRRSIRQPPLVPNVRDKASGHKSLQRKSSLGSVTASSGASRVIITDEGIASGSDESMVSEPDLLQPAILNEYASSPKKKKKLSRTLRESRNDDPHSALGNNNFEDVIIDAMQQNSKSEETTLSSEKRRRSHPQSRYSKSVNRDYPLTSKNLSKSASVTDNRKFQRCSIVLEDIANIVKYTKSLKAADLDALKINKTAPDLSNELSARSTPKKSSKRSSMSFFEFEKNKSKSSRTPTLDAANVLDKRKSMHRYTDADDDKRVLSPSKVSETRASKLYVSQFCNLSDGSHDESMSTRYEKNKVGSSKSKVSKSSQPSRDLVAENVSSKFEENGIPVSKSKISKSSKVSKDFDVKDLPNGFEENERKRSKMPNISKTFQSPEGSDVNDMPSNSEEDEAESPNLSDSETEKDGTGISRPSVHKNFQLASDSDVENEPSEFKKNEIRKPKSNISKTSQPSKDLDVESVPIRLEENEAETSKSKVSRSSQTPINLDVDSAPRRFEENETGKSKSIVSKTIQPPKDMNVENLPSSSRVNEAEDSDSDAAEMFYSPKDIGVKNMPSSAKENEAEDSDSSVHEMFDLSQNVHVENKLSNPKENKAVDSDSDSNASDIFERPKDMDVENMSRSPKRNEVEDTDLNAFDMFNQSNDLGDENMPTRFNEDELGSLKSNVPENFQSPRDSDAKNLSNKSEKNKAGRSTPNAAKTSERSGNTHVENVLSRHNKIKTSSRSKSNNQKAMDLLGESDSDEDILNISNRSGLKASELNVLNVSRSSTGALNNDENILNSEKRRPPSRESGTPNVPPPTKLTDGVNTPTSSRIHQSKALFITPNSSQLSNHSLNNEILPDAFKVSETRQPKETGSKNTEQPSNFNDVRDMVVATDGSENTAIKSVTPKFAGASPSSIDKNVSFKSNESANKASDLSVAKDLQTPPKVNSNDEGVFKIPLSAAPRRSFKRSTLPLSASKSDAVPGTSKSTDKFSPALNMVRSTKMHMSVCSDTGSELESDLNLDIDKNTSNTTPKQQTSASKPTTSRTEELSKSGRQDREELSISDILPIAHSSGMDDSKEADKSVLRTVKRNVSSKERKAKRKKLFLDHFSPMARAGNASLNRENTVDVNGGVHRAAKKMKSPTQKNIFDFLRLKESQTDPSEVENQLDLSYMQFSTEEKLVGVERELEQIRLQEMKLMEMDKTFAEIQSQTENVKKKKKKSLALRESVPSKPVKEVRAAYMINDEVYKRPKLPRPQSWATDKLYRYLWKCLEPKYKLRTRLRSEKFVQALADVMKITLRRKLYENYKDEIDNLMREMAHLGIIRTRHDFYLFCHEFLPFDFRVKATPILLPGNQRTIPYDPKKLHAPILNAEELSAVSFDESC